jgi:hypothetical protein
MSWDEKMEKLPQDEIPSFQEIRANYCISTAEGDKGGLAEKQSD